MITEVVSQTGEKTSRATSTAAGDCQAKIQTFHSCRDIKVTKIGHVMCEEKGGDDSDLKVCV